jgi:hypothetical protein
MDQDTRNKLQRATQQVRRILEQEFAEQLEGTFDVLPDGKILPEPGMHLDARQRLTRQKLVEAIEHIKAGGKSSQEAVDEYTREAAFTFLNRFVALRMLEARGMLQECVSKGDASSGFKEFCGLAPGLSSLDDGGYRLYLECLFDELSVEVKVLFDRRDTASLLWPRRGALTELLEILGQADLTGVWSEDETIGWVYQYFNSGEERKKMREDSSAPRNSRELAVRNQFFTPRYVVEFLTDNTLGSLWYEMRKGETSLVDECRYLVRRASEVFLDDDQELLAGESEAAQQLTQEELLTKTFYITHRAKKDPRDLKILDPACGSGHFLLYAFELLIVIYQEAWHDSNGPSSEVTGNCLSDDYHDLQQLMEALPNLVIRHNLYGIDIDRRATQITALALWIRGQFTSPGIGASRSSRTRVAKSNIAFAEPMPGETSMLEEFVHQQFSTKPERKLLGQLVKSVFEAMRPAGEVGSLLKIEVEIADAITAAREQWKKAPTQVQKVLFDLGHSEGDLKKDSTYSIDGVTDESFWHHAERHIYDALKEYSESSAGNSYQRKLFVEDASDCFGFVDICKQRFDVILMNPPFGDLTQVVLDYVSRRAPNCRRDILTAFIETGVFRLADRGRLGAITKREPLFTSSYEKWRLFNLYENGHLSLLADLGGGVLDNAMVETAAYVVSADDCGQVIGVKATEESLASTVASITIGSPDKNARCISVSKLKSIPGSPFATDVPQFVLDAFDRLDSLEPTFGRTAQGAGTTDDFRFCRLWYEVPISDLHLYGDTSHSPNDLWIPHIKGEPTTPFFGDAPVTIKWGRNGVEVKEYNRMRYGSASRNITNEGSYGMGGLVFPRRTSGFRPRLMPAGGIFSKGGQCIFAKTEVQSLLAVLSHPILDALITPLLGRADMDAQYVLGVIAKVPIPELAKHEQRLAQLVEPLVRYWLHVYEEREESTYFRTNLLSLDNLFGSSIETEGERQAIAFDSMQQDYRELVEYVGELYEHALGHELDDFTQPGNSSSVSIEERYYRRITRLFGLFFGRYCIPDEPSPELSSDNSLRILKLPDLSEIDAKVNSRPSFFVVDSSKGLLSTLLSEVRGPDGVEIPDIASDMAKAFHLDVEDVEAWLNKTFFQVHISFHSGLGRKAPIYWQISNASATYSVWLYYHSLTKDTLFTVLNDEVKPRLRDQRRKLDQLKADAGPEPTRAQRRNIERQETSVAEFAKFMEELEWIAPLWNPELNDGVIVNFAPLWRLVPQNKPWQKECKKVWGKLVQGDYDWAHLAMHLWPERVVPKCHSDRSFAIAHDVEHLLWVEDGKWRPIKSPRAEIDDQRSRRSNQALAPFQKAMDSLVREKGDSIPATRAWRHLSDGDWDDSHVAMLLWPRRVVLKCFEDEALAKTHRINERALNSVKKSGSNDVVVERVIDYHNKFSCSSLLGGLESAMTESEDSFAEFWEYLKQADHDYSALSLLLWPDRIVNQCTEDIDVARQKNMLQFFWVQEQDGGLRRRLSPEEEITAEIGRRASPAVKAALTSLLEAPAPTGGTRRTKRRKATAN